MEQLVDRWAHNPKVVCSSQASATQKEKQMLLLFLLCHSERSEESRKYKVGVIEILPPFGRLNDNLVLTNISFANISSYCL